MIVGDHLGTYSNCTDRRCLRKLNQLGAGFNAELNEEKEEESRMFPRVSLACE